MSPKGQKWSLSALAQFARFVPDRYIKSDIVDVGFVPKATKRTEATPRNFDDLVGAKCRWMVRAVTCPNQLLCHSRHNQIDRAEKAPWQQ